MDLSYDALNYGAYALEYEHSYEFSENVKYATAEFNKLYTRRVRLPDGNNNIIYILSDSFESGIRMLNNENFFIPATYKRVFFPQWYMGTFLRKRMKLLLGKDVAAHKKFIKDNTRYIAWPTRKLGNTKGNIFFLAGDLYDVAKPILNKTPAKRCYTEFLPEFVSILKNMSPEKEAKDRGPAWNNRILIFDVDSFAFKAGAPLKDNKTNPLYLLYLAYFRNKTLETLNVDMDMMICSKNLFIKFNPTKTGKSDWQRFKRALFRIMNANLDNYTEELSDTEKQELEETSKGISVSSIVSQATAPYTDQLSGYGKAIVTDVVTSKIRKTAAQKVMVDSEIKGADVATVTKFNPSIVHAKPGSLNKEEERLFKLIGDDRYEPLSAKTNQFVDNELEDREDDIGEDAVEILTSDKDVAEEILDEIQEENVPLKQNRNAPLNSKRDQKLREQQKKVVVNNETIEQILERDSSNVPIKADDKSKVMHTANENMKSIKFANFDKTYLDELYVKDIVSCFDSFKDKDSPFYITNIDVHDTSTTLDFKETWTVKLRDETNKQHTIKVDIPKFQNDRFMLINGTRFIILKQNFYNPLVKDTPDTVILTTNYNKITITRKATKSTSSIERIFSLIKKTGNTKMFQAGDSSKGNMRYLSTLEFDELSRRLFKFESDGCTIYFNRDYIKDNLPPVKDIKGNEFLIGYEHGNPILINEDTGFDRNQRTIVDIMYSHFKEQDKHLYDSIKGPTQTMYAIGKLAGQFIPVIVTLVVWNGLKTILDRMKIRWNFNPKTRRIPTGNSSSKYIRFADGLFEYEAGMFPEMMLNGLALLHPEHLKFEDMETPECYEEYIYSQWGSYNGITELDTFREFLVDPITKQVCKDFSLPDDATGLMIHAVKLLCDNAYVSKASDKSYRIRSIEMIPAILYGCLSAQYKAYVKSGRRLPFTLPQRAVITKLLAEKTVEPYSVLNPVVEVTKTHTISTKGYKGSNSERSYDEEKRSYDPSAVGKLAISTSPELMASGEQNLSNCGKLANERYVLPS